MKFLIFSLLGLLLTSNSIGQLPTDGLSHYYPFSASPEDVVMGNDAIVVGNVQSVPDRFGIQNCAYSFDGEWTSVMLVQGWGGYQVTADSSFSVSLWYRFGSADAGDREYLFTRGWAYEDSVSFSLLLYDINTPVVGIDMDQHFIDQNLVNWPSDTLWHHLVAIFQPSGFKVYFDNQLGLESNSTIHNMSSVDVHFGENFEGYLDDIAFYNKALSEDEVADLYNAAGTCVVNLEELDNHKYASVFPNPSTDQINIALNDQKVDFLTIHNSNGMKVFEQSLTKGQHQISIQDFPPGVYVLIFYTDGVALGMKRIIKQ